MSTLKRHSLLVDEAIESLGIDPQKCKNDNPNAWTLHRGNLDIIIIIQESQITDQKTTPTITIMCPLCQIDEKNEHFILKKAMEVNHKLTIETLSVSNRWLIISSTYFIDEMKKKEIIDLIENLSYQAHYIENKNLFHSAP